MRLSCDGKLTRNRANSNFHPQPAIVILAPICSRHKVVGWNGLTSCIAIFPGAASYIDWMMQICASPYKSSQILPQRPTIYGAGWGVTEAPFTRKRCENESESLRIVSDTIGFGQSDRRLFTRRRWRDVQKRLRLVRRRSRASFVARRRVQNVNMRGLGHCAPQTDRDSTALSKCIEERASAFIRNISQKENEKK